jgi:hypothetical protein
LIANNQQAEDENGSIKIVKGCQPLQQKVDGGKKRDAGLVGLVHLVYLVDLVYRTRKPDRPKKPERPNEPDEPIFRAGANRQHSPQDVCGSLG